MKKNSLAALKQDIAKRRNLGYMNVGPAPVTIGRNKQMDSGLESVFGIRGQGGQMYGYQDAGQGAPAAPFGTLSSPESVIELTVTNTSTSTNRDVVLFGAFENMFASNQNLGTDITASVGDGSTYLALLSSTASEPQIVGDCKFAFDSTTQRNKSIIVNYRDPGSLVRTNYPIRPQVYYTPAQFDQLTIEAKGLNFPLDGFTQFNFNLEAGESVTFTFFVNSRLKLGNVLQGKSGLEVAS